MISNTTKTNENKYASNLVLLRTNSNRFLTEPLEGNLLGMKIAANLYANNGFRFIAAPAHAEPAQVEAAIQKFRNIYKLSHESALKLSIKTGYDLYAQVEDINRCLSKLQEPRNRIVSELFWPHLSDPLFNEIKKEQCIASSHVMQILKKSVNQHNGYHSAIITHAKAIAYHSLAISHELTFAAGNAEWSSSYWKNALSCWAKVFNTDLFWEYFRKRVESFDDPRLKPDDVKELRSQLPKIILGLNALFAREYAKSKQRAASSWHIDLIGKSRFPKSTKQEILSSLVQTLTVARLEPLIKKVNSDLLGTPGRQSRKDVEKVIRPILEETKTVRNYLIEDLKFSPNLVELSEFDRLCELVVKAIDTKINYDSDDRVHSILYGILTVKKMLSLPLSSPLKRKLEQSNLNDIDTLYSEFQTKKSSRKAIDPTKCWFLEDEEASPDASIRLPIYKITSVKGASVQWQKRQILVPRSELALKVHKGKLTLSKLTNLRQDDKSNEIKAKIGKVEAKRNETIKQIKEKCDHSTRQQKEVFEEKLSAYNNRIAPEEIKFKEHIAKITSQLEKDTAAEQSRCKDVCAEAKKQRARPIARAREAHNRVVEKYKGFRGGTRLELPLVGIASPALAVSALIITLTSHISIFGQPFLLPVAGLVIGSLLGFSIGCAVRLFKIKQSAAPLKKLILVLDNEITRLQEISQKTISELKKRAEFVSAQDKKGLLAIEVEREKIRNDHDTRVKQLRHQTESEIGGVQTTAAKEIKQLEKKLEAHLKPKTESEKTSFPPYKVAKSGDYEDGTGPSEYEINRLVQREFDDFMSSLTYEERNTLALIFHEMSQEKAMGIINMLMTLSPYERSRKLSELSGLNLFGRLY